MKLTGLIATLALVLASCSRENVSHNKEQANDGPASAQPAGNAGSRQTGIQSPKTPELAPDGIFYLIVAARVATRDGIRSLPPGTGVKRVRPGMYLTPAGEVPLDPSQLTNDLGVARAARDAAVATARTGAPPRAAVAVTPTPAATAWASAIVAPTPTVPQFNGMPLNSNKHVPGVATQSTGLQSSTTLGAAHTKVDGGVVWQRSPDGQWWVAVKYTNGRTDGLPSARRVK